MKICLIYQPCGLGDILFIQKIMWYYHNLGYIIICPVVHEFKWLNDYMPWFEFPSWNDEDNKITGPPLPPTVDFPHIDYYNPHNPSVFSEEFVFLNFFANFSEKLIMKAKYNYVNMDFSDYARYIKFKENKEKQEELYQRLVGDKTDYVLVNELFCTRPYVQRKQISVQSENTVHLDIIPGYNLLDWVKILENSREIIMVETAVNYLLEKLYLENRLKCDNFTLYHRSNNFEQVDYLFKIPWSYQ